jgi:nucleotide-binding universal stress UspA family protein
MIFNRILIAVDDSPYSDNAAKAGFELAKNMSAKVALVYAVDVVVPVPGYDLFDVGTDMEIATAENETAGKVMEKIVINYADENMVIQFKPLGSPKEEILSMSRKWNADLIVMGTHHRIGLEHFILGSVAEYVMKHSAIPVLVVPLNKNE